MMKSLVILSAISILAGCASTPNFYNPNNISSAELATITREKHEFELFSFSNKLTTSIGLVLDENGNEVITTSLFGKIKHFSVSLPKGSYKVGLNCELGDIIGRVLVDIDLEPSKEYTAYCREVDKGGRFVKGPEFQLMILDSAAPAPDDLIVLDEAALKSLGY
jgi:hypothetical protein